MRPVTALACGTLFGAGLALSGMTDPTRVLGFLDVLGNWDPTLLVVMAGAVLVSLPAFQWARRHPRPLLDVQFFQPERTRIDADLLIGSVVFGIGWGMAGLCPGPALAGLASGRWEIALFVAAMAAGMALRSWQIRRRAGAGSLRCST
ncbi:MAG: YeeE/YedE family protein [Lysobacterales bacterium]|nr:YeeE/YedE family protein [Xanthomonadales bacterium]MCB1611670.1 YeeE/YedE family protein [Xanthomonadales bacterium]MCP5474229.1 YeeE/YedE family protein [Rhodanobacteraceae bacterium]